MICSKRREPKNVCAGCRGLRCCTKRRSSNLGPATPAMQLSRDQLFAVFWTMHAVQRICGKIMRCNDEHEMKHLPQEDWLVGPLEQKAKRKKASLAIRYFSGLLKAVSNAARSHDHEFGKSVGVGTLAAFHHWFPLQGWAFSVQYYLNNKRTIRSVTGLCCNIVQAWLHWHAQGGHTQENGEGEDTTRGWYG